MKTHEAGIIRLVAPTAPVGLSGAARPPPEACDAETLIVGASSAVRQAMTVARRAATTELPILLVGASGTGKELFAQQIHNWSGRPGPLVDLNCAALPHDMIEAILFGHSRGAFTGAMEHAPGLIEAADRGTLFLDELLGMPPEAQAKLLRVLETGETRRIGESSKRRSCFRIVTAIQDDAAARLETGYFRLDLFQRLAGVVIGLPPLIHREDDLMLLANHFAHSFGRLLGPGAEAVLHAHSWPGNVRELRLTIERAVYLDEHATISARTLAESLQLGAAALGLLPALGIVDQGRQPLAPRERVLAVCEAQDWNAERAAHALGMGRTTLFKHLRAMGISLRRERSSLGAGTLKVDRR